MITTKITTTNVLYSRTRGKHITKTLAPIFLTQHKIATLVGVSLSAKLTHVHRCYLFIRVICFCTILTHPYQQVNDKK